MICFATFLGSSLDWQVVACDIGKTINKIVESEFCVAIVVAAINKTIGN